MKQVLISMLAKQGDTSNPLGSEKSAAVSAGAGQAQAKRVGRTVEEESPKQPKPTVFVSDTCGAQPEAKRLLCGAASRK